jgi:hypothetical protein
MGVKKFDSSWKLLFLSAVIKDARSSQKKELKKHYLKNSLDFSYYLHAKYH